MSFVRLGLLCWAALAWARDPVNQLLDTYAFLRVEETFLLAAKSPRQELVRSFQARKLKFEHDFWKHMESANTLAIGREPAASQVPVYVNETLTPTQPSPPPLDYTLTEACAVAFIVWAPVLFCCSRRKRHRVSRYLA